MRLADRSAALASPSIASCARLYLESTSFDSHNKMPIFQEDILGPGVSVKRFADEAEVLVITNDTLCAVAGPATAARTKR
jgi:acyl-CoA reductase-like NAD-dependent aldehyde dehydrogenase